MKGVIWKRVNRWVSLGIAFALAMCAAFVVFIIYSAYADLSGGGISAWERVMLVSLGLPIGLMGLCLLFGTLDALFEGITGWRPVHPIMYWLGLNPNAGLAKGETPCDLSRYRPRMEEKR